MGASMVLGPAAAAAAATEALMGAAGAGGLGIPAAMPSLVGATAALSGPFGLVIAAGAVMSGVVIVAGEIDKPEMNCWEQILLIDEKNSSGPMSRAQLERRRSHGILLKDLFDHVEVLKGRYENDLEDRLIVKNEEGDHFGFVETLKVPAGTYPEEPNASHDIIILHAVKVVTR